MVVDMENLVSQVNLHQRRAYRCQLGPTWLALEIHARCLACGIFLRSKVLQRKNIAVKLCNWVMLNGVDCLFSHCKWQGDQSQNVPSSDGLGKKNGSTIANHCWSLLRSLVIV